MNQSKANEWLNKLKEYWLRKDIEKAISLFQKTVYYQETPFMKPYTTFEEIREEWKHIADEDIHKIEINLLTVDGNTLIAHWYLEQNDEVYDGIYEIKFNDLFECIYFKSWEMSRKDVLNKMYNDKKIILITGAVLASNNDLIDNYRKITSWIDCDKYKILSPLDTMEFKGNDFEKYDRAMRIIQNSKCIIAEMSNVSTGQGMELQEAINLNIPILVIAKQNSKISSLVKGCKNIQKIIYYDKIENIKDEILKFLKEL